MRTRTLGDAVVTAVGLGDVRLATAEARGHAARDVERAVHDALARGVTLVACGAEEAAERLVGDAVRALRLRDQVVVATQVAVPGARPPAPGAVQHRIEASLRATRLDALPLAELAIDPTWLDAAAWPELVGTCLRLVREGKVVRWGAAIERAAAAALVDRAARPAPRTEPPSPALGIGDLFGGLVAPAPAPAPAPGSPAAGTAALLGAPFVAIAVELSACARDALPLLGPPHADAPALPVLARHPLAGGALAGTLGPGARRALRDDRGALDAATLERIAVACAELAPLVRDRPPAATSCDPARAALERAPRPPHVEATTLGELALRYLLDHGACVLPRVSSPDHVAPLLAAAAAPPLSAEVVRRIEDVLRAPA